MIDWNKSAELNKLSVDELKEWFKKFPGSEKRIIAVCDDCKIERELYFYGYRARCLRCVQSTPEYGRNHSESLLKHYNDHPDARKKISKRVIQYNIDHPDARESASKKAIERWADPELRDVQSRQLKKYYANNPDARTENSARRIQYYIDNPNALRSMSDRMIQYYVDHPEAKLKMSELMKNLESTKTNAENMRGGNDIVHHHYLYDAADKSKYTMPITRSEHTSMHHRMWADGYEVPHINSAEDSDTLWGYNMVV